MKKSFAFIPFLLSVILLFTGCGESLKNQSQKENTMQNNTTATYTRITPEQAKDRMDGANPVIVLDVRTQAEYEQGHIQNAVLLPNENIGDTRPESLPNLDTEILVYCRSGNRSAQAAKKLIDLGYTKVYDFGGINAWPYQEMVVTE